MSAFPDSKKMQINDLPDLLILEIFSYLTTKEICLSSKVCQLWNKIGRDKSLWRDIDMSNTRLDLRKAWKFYRARLSDCLRSMKMQGYYHNRTARKQKKPILSDALLEDIRTNCPNIQKINFEYIDLSCISSSKLPRSLRHLTLNKCGWPVGWLNGVELPELQALEVIDCVRVDDNELKFISAIPSLEKLSLHGSYRVKDEGMTYLAKNLTQITHLELVGVPVTDLSIHHVCRNMKNLQTLKVVDCCITNSGVQTISASLRKLQDIDLSRNKNIDQHCLKSFLKGVHVKSLTIDLDPKTIDEDLLFQLENQFPGKLINNFVDQ